MKQDHPKIGEIVFTTRSPFFKSTLICSQFNKMSGQTSHLSSCLVVSSLQDFLIEDGNVPNGEGCGSGDQELIH